MANKILDDVKMSLDIADKDDSFNYALIPYISMGIAILNQNGIGKTITELSPDTTWDDLQDPSQVNGNPYFGLVKQYLYSKIKILFDPPALTSTRDTIQSVIDELLWRSRLAYEPDNKEVNIDESN